MVPSSVSIWTNICLFILHSWHYFELFIYLGFYVAFNTVQVISRQVVGRAEETSTYSSLGFCTVNCRPTASSYQLSHLRPCAESNPSLRWEARVLSLCHRGPLLNYGYGISIGFAQLVFKKFFVEYLQGQLDVNTVGVMVTLC